MAVIDLTRNRIPENVKTIHLVAVCGTGMGALAGMLKDQGLAVTGSDHKVYPPMSEFLARKGIPVADGFSRRNLLYGPDLVVVGNAVRRDNPEVAQLIDSGGYFCSMPQALNHFAAAGKKPLLVTGTHGKTTTAAILAWMLRVAAQHSETFDPSFFIGGIVRNFNSNYRLSGGRYMVIEGDEYDTAFFDKGPKFMHYDPAAVILTSVEFDHADIFRDLLHVKAAFDRFLARLNGDCGLFVYDGDKTAAELAGSRNCPVLRYGRHPNSAWWLKQFTVEPPWTFFTVYKKGRFYGEFKTRLMGEHNLMNALADIAVADRLMVPRPAVEKALETFEGARRRQEVRGVRHGITVVDDFAHHPTAVRETVRAIKPFCRNGRLIAVFEPRTNSSMRRVFQAVYPGSFDAADLICIRRPPLLSKIPRGERFSSEKLVADLTARGKKAHYFEDTEAIVDYLAVAARSGDTILVMSNGGFDNIHEKLLRALA